MDAMSYWYLNHIFRVEALIPEVYRCLMHSTKIYYYILITHSLNYLNERENKIFKNGI